jgi:phosphomevalonate kinase
MNSFLKKIDNYICQYFGIGEQKTVPTELRVQGKNLFVSSTDSFKRHHFHNRVDVFCAANIKQLDKINKKRLGSAIGKTLAKDLLISFEDFSIKKT